MRVIVDGDPTLLVSEPDESTKNRLWMVDIGPISMLKARLCGHILEGN